MKMSRKPKTGSQMLEEKLSGDASQLATFNLFTRGSRGTCRTKTTTAHNNQTVSLIHSSIAKDKESRAKPLKKAAGAASVAKPLP